jgi:hypothetical protein
MTSMPPETKKVPNMLKKADFLRFFAIFCVFFAFSGHFSRIWAESSLPGLPWDDPPPEFWFPVGEEIDYYIQWGVFTVGEATAKTAWTNVDGRRLLTLTVEAESNGIVEKIYPVKEFLQTVVDPVTFLPLSFVKKSREGRREHDEITTFDHKTLKGHWYSKKKQKEKHFDIQPDTRDLMGLMYWIRKDPIGPRETRHYEVMTDEKLYELIVEAGKREPVSLQKYGRVKCIKMEPKGKFDGMFIRKGRMWLWLSDDERYAICRVAASVPVASIKIMLKNIRGPGDDFWVAD